MQRATKTSKSTKEWVLVRAGRSGKFHSARFHGAQKLQ